VSLQKPKQSWAWWCTPVPSTQETEAGQPGKEPVSRKKKKKVHRKSKQRQRPVFISKEDVFS
jgi:hypothetical protein